jgi:hypothetical protein
VGVLGRVSACSEVADTNGRIAVQAEDFEERVSDGRRCGNDGPADDGQLAGINIAAPDGETTGNDGRDAEHKTKQHDDRKTVADAGLEIGGGETAAAALLSECAHRVENNDRGDEQTRAKSRIDVNRHGDAVAHRTKCFLDLFHGIA